MVITAMKESYMELRLMQMKMRLPDASCAMIDIATVYAIW